MILRILFLFFCAIGMITTSAHAQLYLEQSKVVLSVSGGDHINGSIAIHNTAADPMIIKVYWEDFEYKTPYDGTKSFFPAGTTPGSASQWVTFSPQAFTVPGFGQQIVDYTVAVPNTIQEGHYGVLFFERSILAKVNNEDVNLVTRIGSLFFIEPKNKIKKAVIQDFGLKENDLIANFVNQGNVVLIPHTTYYVMQGNGLVLLRGEIKNLYVPPGVSAGLKIHFKKKLNAGNYTLVVNSDLEEGDVAVKEIGLAVNDAGQLTVVNSQDS